MSLLRLMTQQTAERPPLLGPAPQDATVSTARADGPPPQAESAADELSDGTTLYVGTNLDSREASALRSSAREVDVGGICMRRLDPDYYAWIHHKMTLARKAETFSSAGSSPSKTSTRSGTKGGRRRGFTS